VSPPGAEPRGENTVAHNEYPNASDFTANVRPAKRIGDSVKK
jgi:hypothetical protein